MSTGVVEANDALNYAENDLLDRTVFHNYDTISEEDDDTQTIHTSTYDPLLSNHGHDESDSTEQTHGHSHHDDEPDDGIILKQQYLHLPKRQQPSYKLLLFGLALFVTGCIAPLPSILDALVYLICRRENGDVSFNDPKCLSTGISAQVGMFQSYQSMLEAVFAAITIPFLSSLSDGVGRRPIFVWGIFCSTTALTVTLACTLFPHVFSYKLLFLSSVISGLGGSVMLMGVITSSYISDSVKERYRASILSITDAIVFSGIALGPVLGSFVLTTFNHSVTTLFGIAIALQLSFMFIVLFLLPESITSQKLAEYANAKAKQKDYHNSISLNFSARLAYILKEYFLHPMKALKLEHIPKSQNRIRWNVYIVIGLYSILMELSTSVFPLMFLYAKSQFGWTSVENGVFMSVLGSSKFCVLALVLPFCLRWLRNHYDYDSKYVDKSDVLLLRFGLIASFGCYILLSEASSGKVFMMTAMFFALNAMELPIIRNIIIKHSTRERVGEMLGLAQFISRFFSFFCPALFALVYNKSIQYRPQLVFELVAGIFVLMLISISFLHVGEQKTIDEENN